jgi:hypothetical protein
MRAHPDHRPRRFSEGQEHTPGLPASARVGRFSDGLTGLLADAPSALRVGTFADGSVLRPDAPAVRRIGGFADQFVPSAGPAAARPRLGLGGPSAPRPHPA